MVVLPGRSPVAVPMLPAAMLMIAMDDAEEVHVTAEVRSRISPFANVPVAVNWTGIVAGAFCKAGFTPIDVSAANSTTKLAVAVTDPDCAAMVVVPWVAEKKTCTLSRAKRFQDYVSNRAVAHFSARRKSTFIRKAGTKVHLLQRRFEGEVLQLR